MKPSAGYMLIVLRKNRKERSKSNIEGAHQSESQKSLDSYKEELLLPPSLPSLRVKPEADDDKIEQMHQERLQNQKIKQEVAEFSPMEQPLLKDEYDITFDDEGSEKNGKKYDNNDEANRQHSYRRSRSNSEEESSNSEDEKEEDDDDDKSEDNIRSESSSRSSTDK